MNTQTIHIGNELHVEYTIDYYETPGGQYLPEILIETVEVVDRGENCITFIKLEDEIIELLMDKIIEELEKD